MFLWTILHKSESDLVRKFLAAQELNPVRNDLATTFKNDLELCGITLTMTDISKMKKAEFKKVVHSHLKELAKEYLFDLKAKNSKLSKVSNTYKFDSYLSSMNITTEEKQCLFKFRTRMVEVKANFKNHYRQNLNCYFCPEEETQIHIFSCKEIIEGLDLSEVSYNDIFGNLPNQEKIARILNKILKQRKSKIIALNT